MFNGLVFLGIMFALFELAWAQPAQVRVRNEAQIAIGNVELGAIADIKSTNIEDEKVLRGLILGETPAAGKVAEWSATEISKRLHPYSRVLQGVKLQLPDHIMIRRVVTSITRDELKARIEEMLKARMLPDSSWEAQLTDLGVSASGLDIPPDGSIQVVPPLTRPRGAANIELQIFRNGQVVARKWITARVTFTAKVAVIQRQIDSHSHISDAEIRWQKKDVTYLSDIPATESDIPSATAKFTLQPGNILTRSQLEREVALRFGEDVQMIAGGDAFSVSLRGLSQQSGFIGDTVKVKNMATNKVLSGVVVAKGVVRVAY